jgi:hypothetical protein
MTSSSITQLLQQHHCAFEPDSVCAVLVVGCCCVCPLRARKVLELLKKEVELCRLQADIREQVGEGGGMHSHTPRVNQV